MEESGIFLGGLYLICYANSVLFGMHMGKFGCCKCKQMGKQPTNASCNYKKQMQAASASKWVSNLKMQAAIARCKCKLQMQVAIARCKLKAANACLQHANSSSNCKLQMFACKCKLQLQAANACLQPANASCN
ncbi:hypothetical protein Tco_1411802 [Tanacetum coccineum]